MNNTKIAIDPYLTDTKDESYMHIYTFLCTQSQNTQHVRNYLWEIGLFDMSDIYFFRDMPNVTQEIYSIVDEPAQILLRTQYLHSIRRLINQPTFGFCV